MTEVAKQMPTEARLCAFRETVREHYREHGRSFPWRARRTPYRVLVSELMLQQTQADRVVPFFERFTARFPDVRTLARARLATVLKLWSGLGYNRRAKFLHEAARAVVREHGGVVPVDEAALRSLPGVGPYTAAAVTAFAGDRPATFIETNIRSVFIHEFFGDREGIPDSEILPLIGKTVDREQPAEWYQALMDYGAFLKRQGINPSRRSAHYTRQAPFAGSDRQLRGAVLRELLVGKKTETELRKKLQVDIVRHRAIVTGLRKDGLIKSQGNRFKLA